ncbi:uncharacterized protein LOC135050225 isoform X2 [Pseudophryne corroboree]|uniref:uncharacterized protein LOC135050225 isoform X2 n=1 Tax=Pseudophryne corroboree TaxID=495146 RepID=UPI003081A2CA
MDDEIQFWLLVLGYVLSKRKKRRRETVRNYWVHPLTSQRFSKGQFHLRYGDLRTCPKRFFNYFKMSVGTFDELLEHLRPALIRSDTKMRLAISPEERLYLATGHSFTSLHFRFLIGKATIRLIVRETCKAICDTLLNVFMPEPTVETWKKIAGDFYTTTSFPNCIGALDAKDIRMKMPPNSGAKHWDSSKHSLVLLALVDSNYNFIAIDVGAYGTTGCCSIFKKSTLGRKMKDGKLHLPGYSVLPNTNGPPMPFVFVADEAFGLSENILRPYPTRNITPIRKVFNYRLVRARRAIDSAFGILANKWRVFYAPIQLESNFVEGIIKAACVLHNLVLSRDGFVFDHILSNPLHDVSWSTVRGPVSGMLVRNSFASYFVSPEGEIPWQNEKI